MSFRGGKMMFHSTEIRTKAANVTEINVGIV